MSDEETKRTKVIESLRRLLDSLLAAIETRLELFGVEFKVEKYRLIELLFLTAVAVCFGMMAVVLFAITLVLLVPEEYRIHVVAGVCLVSAFGTLGSVLRLRARLKNPPPFADTLAQLKKDREWFTSKK